MSALVDKARAIATGAHEGQRRKDGPPYIIHPEAVAEILAGRAFPDTVVAAAWVHDVLEDTPYPANKLREELGQEVLDIVEAVSEDKSLPWEERKQGYIEKVRQGPEGAKAVATADKIHNLTSVLAVYAERGKETWKFFNRSREQKVWFEEAMLAMLKEAWRHPLVGEYEQLVERLRVLE
jgi:(p)ppGpp synthase/HD superfamily hydrolase